MIVKMCGIRRMQDVLYANEVQPDYIGFIFAKSKRYIKPQDAAILQKQLDPSIKTVGVFVNEPVDSMLNTAKIVGLDVLQLHGDETEKEVKKIREKSSLEIWKAVRVQTVEDIIKAEELLIDRLLLDSFSKEAYGGTGKVMDIALIEQAKITKPYLIAGGLHRDNLQEIIQRLHPQGIDISSGIETDGYKDLEKMKEIMKITGGNYE
ncbi:phosphoribosylanthranilate isomerase [Anaerostipes sp. MSJ-23]|uniref:phosphoribosylanthranilate isomerase n=1 Tax=Anaerostipes sp. MSJ-23 TaxID=2841520 RepID=UPI001C123878|nr:phosphoribosylanthranilate isomerase [Anaerostipes sp. MSJ-23]MBU5459127.1 phosphoribosylanthranilate isomerase [Anaerostipes sp. MSJ-23]